MVKSDAFTLLSMLIRAIALWVACAFLVGIPSMLIGMRNNQYAGSDRDAYVLLAVALGALVVLALMWLFADKIAKLALVRPHQQVFESDLEPRVWLGLAISVIGAWYLFGGLKDLAYLLPRWFIFSREPGPMLPDVLQQLVPELFAVIFELVLATVFLLRGQGLARWVQRMRYGDTGIRAD